MYQSSGRSEAKVNRLLQQVRDRDSITPLMLDYTDKQAFSSALKQTIQRNGAVQLITAWVHLEGAPAFNSILPHLVQDQPWRLLHILGSKRNADKEKDAMPIPVGCPYCHIQLGHLEEQDGKC